MNFKNTFGLLILVGLLAGLFRFGPELGPRMGIAPAPAANTGASSLDGLVADRSAQDLTRIEIQHGDRRITFSRGPGGGWVLPGNWPTRKAAVEELLGLLAGLHSRFNPLPVTNVADFKSYGLEPPEVIVTLNSGGAERKFKFGEKEGDKNQFTRPTFLRVNDENHVFRLAPGLVGKLDRPLDYYQQRRLFPAERTAREGEAGGDKVERLAAKEVEVKGPQGEFDLVHQGDSWESKAPVKDRVDPEQLRLLMSAVPDLWAEQFVTVPKGLAEYGLDKPEQTLSVTTPSGEKVTLLIGKQSQMKTRTVMRPGPSMGGAPAPPQKEIIHDEYRFAKLRDNDQVFEIQAAKLKDIFAPFKQIRDANLARFRADQVQRVEIKSGGQDLVMANDKGQWKIEKPLTADADSARVMELLDKLAFLQARDKDVIDKGDAKALGLAPPAATVTLTVEEEKTEGKTKSKAARKIEFDLGKTDVDQAKTYVRVAGFERINAVEDAVAKLVQRPALAYRGRKVLPVTGLDIGKVEVHRPGDVYSLEQANGSWRLAAPAQVDVDPAKSGKLAAELSNLEAVEHVGDTVPEADLEPKYGLGASALKVVVQPSDAMKPASTLLLGKPREGKPEIYAKLASAPGVFTLKKELRENLDQDSLSFRSPQLWTLAPTALAEVKISKEKQEFSLKRQGANWQIGGAFEAPATAEPANALATDLAALKAEKVVAHTAKDLAVYGLDKPYERVAIVEAPKPKLEGAPEPPASPGAAPERVLLIGKLATEAPGSRYAKLADKEAVFVLGPKIVGLLDRPALDYVSRSLASWDPKQIQELSRQSAEGPLRLVREAANWRVTESKAPPFPADAPTVDRLIDVFGNLDAERIAAYGPKTDWKEYGLDKPATKWVIRLGAAAGTPPAKPAEHTLALGKLVPDGNGARFARLDDGPAVAVLAPEDAAILDSSHLDFVGKSLLQTPVDRVDGIVRVLGKDTLELRKKGDNWQIVRPAEAPADDVHVRDLASKLAGLRVPRIAGYPVKDLQEFGLKEPAATIAIQSATADGKKEEHSLRIGKAVKDGAEDRYVQADKSEAVGVLPGELVRQLMGPPLSFRDRTLARARDIESATLERGVRKVTFAKVNGVWKVTAPLSADMETAEWQALLDSLAKLRGAELVADKPSDLKPYGLDRPAAEWRFRAGDKDVLALQVGALERVKKDGKELPGDRVYARVAGSPFVALLDAKTSAAVLGEYRSRAPWRQLDAAQVNGVVITWPKSSLELTKAGQAWQLAGDPGKKVNDSVLRDLLDKLARLRVERFVDDKGADFKLYGLQPPQVRWELREQDGKRILEIGRPEGSSSRYYARVVDGDRSDVFVLPEADAALAVGSAAALAP